MAMHNKRFDIQGLRAWAVVAVVIFHFFPTILPLGYLGVDVFFVLSGFLISLVLEGKICSSSTYHDFYFKRLKRIFPLALLVASLNLILISQNESPPAIKSGTRSALYAILFVTNHNVRDAGEDYFEALEKANDYFTHYWSLSVEIQFYILAPLLLHIFKPSDAKRLHHFYFSVIALCSLFVSFHFPAEDAFSSTICRLWQFLSGAIAFHMGKAFHRYHLVPGNELPENEETSSSSDFREIASPLAAVLIAATTILYCGDKLSFIRLGVTVWAATVLVLQSTSALLCHKSLQLLGDASYALYLIHWPIVCVLKDWEVDNPTHLFIALIFCFVIAFVLHFTFEKWYLTLSQSRTFALVGVLYVLSAAMIYINSLPRPAYIMDGKFNPALSLLQWEPGSKTNYTEAQVQQMNKLLGQQLAESLTLPDCIAVADKEKNDRFKFCHFPKGRGKLKFLIIGNSYALSPGKLVLKHFNRHYGEISIRAVPHCEPLILTKHNMCKDVKQAHRKFIEDITREKPDILFISSRYENPAIPIAGNVTQDPLFHYMKDKLETYGKLVTKKIFIMNSFPLLNSPIDAEKKRKANQLPVEGYMPEAIRADDELMRKRNDELAKICKKCVFYDIKRPHLNEKGQFLTVDPVSKLRYFEHTVHYTSIGLQVIEPVFVQLSIEFPKLLEAKFPSNIFELKH